MHIHTWVCIPLNMYRFLWIQRWHKPSCVAFWILPENTRSFAQPVVRILTTFPSFRLVAWAVVMAPTSYGRLDAPKENKLNVYINKIVILTLLPPWILCVPWLYVVIHDQSHNSNYSRQQFFRFKGTHGFNQSKSTDWTFTVHKVLHEDQSEEELGLRSL